jgi:RNA polymerase sigma-70 factor (ECF subfamily)
MTSQSPAERVPLELLLEHREWVRALARSLVTDPNAADDVEQETWRMALERPPRHAASLRAWFGTVVRNAARVAGRNEKSRVRRESAAALQQPQRWPDDLVAEAEIQHRLVEAVLELEEPYRATVLARFFQGMEAREIAARSGVPVETVRTRLKRATALLRERMDDRHGGRRAWALLLLGRRSPTATAATAAVLGGALMAKKLLAAAVLLVLLGGAWLALRPRDEGATATRSAEIATAEGAPQKTPRAHTVAETAPPAPPPSADPVGLYATGRVVDSAGAPVAGAVVVSAPDIDWSSAKAKENRETKTNADGRFRVALADVAPTFRLVADGAGLGLASAKAVRAGDDVILTLAGAATLTGRVTDLDGAPVGMARVRWIGLVGEGALLVREAVATADGAYRLDGIPSALVWQGLGNSYDSRLAATAEGFAPLSVQWDPIAGPPKLDLRLVRGATLVGRVTDGETGHAVADARILVSSYEYPEPGGAGGPGLHASRITRLLAECRSDAEGRFRVEHMPASGFHPLRVNAGGQRGAMIGRAVALAPGYAPGDDEIPVPYDGATVDADIKLWSAASVTGRVIDAKGRPLAGIEVFELTMGRLRTKVPSQVTDAPPYTVRTDTDGRYRLDGVNVTRAAPAKIHLYATNDALRQAMSNGAAIELDAKAGDVIQAPDIVFAPDVASGRVVVTDGSGRPIWGARASFDQFRCETRSDRDGRVEFLFTYNRAGIPPKPVCLIIRADGFAPVATPTFTPSKTDPPEVRVALAPGRRVAGRVVREDGTPASGALIDVMNSAVPLDVMFPASGVPLGAGNPPGPQFPRLVHYAYASAHDDGTFDIGDLPEGQYSLRVTGPPGPGVATATDVATDTRDLVLTLPALTPPAVRGALEVVVTDAASGAVVPHPSATLWGGAPTTSPPVEASDVPGTLKWSNLPSGAWTLRIAADGYIGTERAVTVGAGEPTRVALTIVRGATVRGKVTVAEGLERRDLRVCFSQPEGGAGPLATVVDASGAFELKGLAAGRWRIDVMRPNAGNPRYATDVLVEFDVDGNDARVDLRVVLTGTVAVKVDGASRELGESERGRYRILDGDGREIEKRQVRWIGVDYAAFVRPGAYDVVLEMPGRARETRRVAVDAGGRATATF